MIVAATLAATAVSLAALGYLAATDPKRRRAFRLPPAAGRRRGSAGRRCSCRASPSPGWPAAGGFLVWFGAVTVAGWAIAALRPQRAERARHALAAAAASPRGRRRSAPPSRAAAAVSRRCARRPARRTPRREPDRGARGPVAALEAELAALRDGPRRARIDAVVVELQRPARR